MAATGSTGELAVDQPRLQAALDRLVGELVVMRTRAPWTVTPSGS